MALTDVFPDYPSSVLAPYVWKPRFKTFVAGPFNNENIVTRAGIAYPLHSTTVRFLTSTGWGSSIQKAVYEFFVARRGRFDFFTFYDVLGWDASPVGILWTGCFVGIGDATTLIFDLPLRNANNDSNRKIYCGGVDKTSNGSWAQGTGTGGRDRFTFSTYTPTAGQIITCDGIARRVWKAGFVSDDFAMTAREANLYEFQVDLAEIP